MLSHAALMLNYTIYIPILPYIGYVLYHIIYVCSIANNWLELYNM